MIFVFRHFKIFTACGLVRGLPALATILTGNVRKAVCTFNHQLWWLAGKHGSIQRLKWGYGQQHIVSRTCREWRQQSGHGVVILAPLFSFFAAAQCDEWQRREAFGSAPKTKKGSVGPTLIQSDSFALARKWGGGQCPPFVSGLLLCRIVSSLSFKDWERGKLSLLLGGESFSMEPVRADEAT